MWNSQGCFRMCIPKSHKLHLDYGSSLLVQFIRRRGVRRVPGCLVRRVVDAAHITCIQPYPCRGDPWELPIKRSLRSKNRIQTLLGQLISVDFCWFLLISVDFCWFLLISVDFCWFLLISVDFCWFLLISVDFCWFLLISVDFCWFLLISVDFCWFLLICCLLD